MGSPGSEEIKKQGWSSSEGEKTKRGDEGGGSITGIIVVFRYADWLDILLMALGALGAVGDGMSMNCILVFAGRIMNSMGYGQSRRHNDDGTSNFMVEVEKCSLYFVYVGLAVLVSAFMEGYCWSKTSERQVLRIRYKYLEAVLRQEVGFFDSQEATTWEVVNSISKDTSLLQEVLSEKVPLFLMHISTFVSGIAFSAWFSWRLSLVAYPTLVLLVIPGMMYGKFLVYVSKQTYEEYGKANLILSQALSSIKTIYSFTAEKTVVEKYGSVLDRTTKLGIKQGIAKGLAVGSNGISFAIWAFLAWYGSLLVMHRGDQSGGMIYTAAISFILGGLSLGSALPELKHFTDASVAASRMFERIDRVPKIMDDDDTGLEKKIVRINLLQGNIEFEHVHFAYPSRPDSTVLKDFSLKVEAGKTVALVGASGSGKSTVIALLQRFYDASSGAVKIDGVDIRCLQLHWIRGKMGLVSQEHALFGTISIKENIMFGKLDASMDEVVAAAKAANAHSFIMGLQDGYETKIGEGGSLLSGGQKQRIAIARALIRNPVILLLDEATSALDNESEKLVQNALDQASMGRTTLVIAHKLSTVRNAHEIAVMSGGGVVEIGSHKELMKSNPNGHYSKLASIIPGPDIEDDEADPSSLSSSVDQTTIPASLRISSSSSTSTRCNISPADPAPAIITKNDSKSSSLIHLIRMLDIEWKQGVIGCLSAMAYGAVHPIYALTVGGMIACFFVEDHEQMRSEIRTYSATFSLLCLMSLALNLSQHYNLAYMGEHLIRRVRLRLLERVLTFEAAWFDREENSSGSLCSRMSHDVSTVRSLVVDRLCLLVQTASSVSIAMGMGLMVAWKLALVMIAVHPLTIMCFYTRKVMLSGVSGDFVRAQSRSAQIAAESVYNHRIVTAYSCGNKVVELFEESQEVVRAQAKKKAWLAGLGIGWAQCLTFMSWALDFWFGGKLVEKGEISAGDVFKTFYILVSTGKVIAEAGSMTSDLAKGSSAVASVLSILVFKAETPTNSSSIVKVTGGGVGVGGRIELINIDFSYPCRPDTLILNRFSLDVKAGSSMGLVGRSGCGKSTVISLIQRMYNVSRGSVRVDGFDIREFDVVWYRKQLAIVSQEPVLFSGTIRDNIVFGKPEATEDEVVGAAKAANAHEFISALKDGYHTQCGERGVQLSGGQKQRIAIARAIIRNPTILLLDEATSALDLQSERLVQEALDRLVQHSHVRITTVVVAHRLNTVENLDCIAYVDKGRVVEKGTYAQLMNHNRRGPFFKLANNC